MSREYYAPTKNVPVLIRRVDACVKPSELVALYFENLGGEVHYCKLGRKSVSIVVTGSFLYSEIDLRYFLRKHYYRVKEIVIRKAKVHEGKLYLSMRIRFR